MKTLTLLFCLICTFALGQSPSRSLQSGSPPSGEPLPANYLLTLSVSDKDQPFTELSLVVATADFSTDAVHPIDAKETVTMPASLTFTGSISVQEDGSVLIRYLLSYEVAIPTNMQTTKSANGEQVTNSSIQFKRSSTQASAKLRLSEPIQILKSGTRTYRLTISRLTDKPSKSQ